MKKASPSLELQNAQFETKCLHSDRGIEKNSELAPPIHVTASFTPNDEGMLYSRSHAVTRSRAETVLGTLEGGKAILYSSGVAATFAFLSLYKPAKIAISGGYHGTHNVINALKFSSNLQNFEIIDHDSLDGLKKGDVIWLESPRNPTLEVEDLRYFVEKAKAVEARVIVDSTTSTPVLCRPLEFGADVVLHSTTKFLGGHSDSLGGALIVKDPFMYANLLKQRTTIGNVPGSLEVWLLLRSLRTLPIRVERQSQTAETIVQYLLTKQPDLVRKVFHPSLPTCKGHELVGEAEDKQMKYGGPLISFVLRSEDRAKNFPQHLKLILEATSFGGCESTIDWRAKSDTQVDRRLLRLSVGLEHASDLISDLETAFEEILKIDSPVEDTEDEDELPEEEEEEEEEKENERLSDENERLSGENERITDDENEVVDGEEEGANDDENEVDDGENEVVNDDEENEVDNGETNDE